MSERIHALAQHLLGKSTVDECSLEEIQHLAKRYPYFAPAQFLLLQKLKAAGLPDYEAQQRKAVLYYPDPLQFEYFMSSDKFLMEESVLVKPAEETKTGTDEVIPTTITLAEEQAFLQQELAEEAAIENSTVASPVEAVPVIDGTGTDDQPAHFMEPDKVEEPELVDTPEPVVLETSPLPDSPATSNKSETTFSEHPDKEVRAVEGKEAQVSSQSIPETETAASTSVSDATSADITTAPTAPATEEPLAFEPYHTVDYFASQGIKITSDELPKDKLSKQLRSFTEWLKIMKRLPAADIGQSQKSAAETSVESLASHSVEGSDVVTEAMAEVWIKQGAIAKAIETYNKLSLLNPSKKAYFAAKIENLRGS